MMQDTGKSITFIHALALVTAPAQIGRDCKIYQFASIFNKAKIGDRTVVGPCAMINGSEIGEDCLVSYGVNMGPGFRVGNGVFLGPEVVLCNDMWPRVDKTGFDVARLDTKEAPAVIIEDGASLGTRVTVLPGVRIGRNAMIAAHSVVKRDVPDNHIHYANGRLEPITNEERQRETRMRFARDHSLPSEELTREQETFLRTVGLDDAQVAAVVHAPLRVKDALDEVRGK